MGNESLTITQKLPSGTGLAADRRRGQADRGRPDGRPAGEDVHDQHRRHHVGVHGQPGRHQPGPLHRAARGRAPTATEAADPAAAGHRRPRAQRRRRSRCRSAAAAAVDRRGALRRELRPGAAQVGQRQGAGDDEDRPRPHQRRPATSATPGSSSRSTSTSRRPPTTA